MFSLRGTHHTLHENFAEKIFLPRLKKKNSNNKKVTKLFSAEFFSLDGKGQEKK